MKGLTQVDPIQYEPVRQTAEIKPAQRAFYLSYWNEKGIEKEALLTGIHDFLVPRKYFVIMDQGWSDWDLKVSRGLWARAELKAVGENHGDPKRLVRLRVALRLSRLSSLVLRIYGGVALAGFLLSTPLWFWYDPRNPDFQFVERDRWIPSIGAEYVLGVDGISTLLILLATLIGFIAVLSSWSAITERVKEYYFALLVLQTGMLGAFMSLDFLLFFLFWEVMLVPMYFLIGI